MPLGNDARHFLVIASLANGTGEAHPHALFVDRETPGLTVGERERNMGLKALATTRISFDGCKIPRGAAPRGRRVVGRCVSPISGASPQASMAVGSPAPPSTTRATTPRNGAAFGQAIAQKQAIAFMLAEMAMEVDAMRLLTWEAAWKLDRHEDATREAHLAKRYAADMTLKITDNALQVLGGHGYIRDHLVELFLRNARSFVDARRFGDRLKGKRP